MQQSKEDTAHYSRQRRNDSSLALVDSRRPLSRRPLSRRQVLNASHNYWMCITTQNAQSASIRVGSHRQRWGLHGLALLTQCTLAVQLQADMIVALQGRLGNASKHNPRPNAPSMQVCFTELVLVRWSSVTELQAVQASGFT